MATITDAQIAAQTRLQQIAVAAVARAWDRLGTYHEPDVAVFLAIVVPLILAAQRQSAALTNAYLARVLERAPLAFDVERVIGPAIRSSTPAVVAAAPTATPVIPDAGVPPDVVYRRPFVTTWTALARDMPLADAIAAGRAQATGSAAMDVQNTMRHTLVAVGELDDRILGYRRVPNADACDFCKLIAGRRYLKSDLMEVHTHCKCGVDVITAANRGDFTGKPENDLAVSADRMVSAVTRIHGELGPLLVDGHHHFTGPDDLAA